MEEQEAAGILSTLLKWKKSCFKTEVIAALLFAVWMVYED